MLFPPLWFYICVNNVSCHNRDIPTHTIKKLGSGLQSQLEVGLEGPLRHIFSKCLLRDLSAAASLTVLLEHLGPRAHRRSFRVFYGQRLKW